MKSGLSDKYREAVHKKPAGLHGNVPPMYNLNKLKKRCVENCVAIYMKDRFKMCFSFLSDSMLNFAKIKIIFRYKDPRLAKISDSTLKVLGNFLTEKEYFKFSFVRHPFDRYEKIMVIFRFKV